MRVTKAKTIIIVDDKEYEIIKAFCEALTEIYENDSFTNMGDIVESIAYEGRKFEDFEIEVE